MLCPIRRKSERVEHVVADRLLHSRRVQMFVARSRLPSDSLGGVNGRQEGKLTRGAGNCNGKAKEMFRLRVFLAIARRESLLVMRCIYFGH